MTPEDLNNLDVDSITSQFAKFGDVATNALKGIAAAAALASQNNMELSNIINNATIAATKAGSQNLSDIQKNNALALKETEDFQKAGLDIQTKYQAQILDGLDQTAQQKKRMLDAEFANAKSGADALITLADLVIDNGKKNAEAQKATALVQIGIDTAKAISSLVAASNENPANAATSGVAGIVQFAAGIAEILVNIEKAKDVLNGGSPSVSRGASPAIAGASSGINTNAPNLSAPRQINAAKIDRTTSSNTQQQGIIKAYVVESEITDAQKRASTLKSMSLH